jgi:hypothetical protein
MASKIAPANITGNLGKNELASRVPPESEGICTARLLPSTDAAEI